MAKNNKPKCVMVLTEGPSDRAALNDFLTEMYSLIDEKIEVFFPVMTEAAIEADGSIELNYNGDITSRNGIVPDKILPMLLKLFIHPELEKHPGYKYPGEIHEVIHIVDIDGAYLDDDRIITAKEDDDRHLPYYDDENNTIVARDTEDIIERNERKRNNLKKLVETKRLRITIAKDRNETKEKPYKVFFFSSNLDHVLFGKANNEKYYKVSDARSFGSSFFDEPLKMARYFIDHPAASTQGNYHDSWQELMDDTESLKPATNLNILVKDLLKRAKISVNN